VRADEPKPPDPALEHDVTYAAHNALVEALRNAGSCRLQGGPTGLGRAEVAFGPDGAVRAVEILTDRFRNTGTGSCIAMLLWNAKIEPFQGEPPRINKWFEVAKSWPPVNASED
jgi:hypothetical protein